MGWSRSAGKKEVLVLLFLQPKYQRPYYRCYSPPQVQTFFWYCSISNSKVPVLLNIVSVQVPGQSRTNVKASGGFKLKDSLVLVPLTLLLLMLLSSSTLDIVFFGAVPQVIVPVLQMYQY